MKNYKQPSKKSDTVQPKANKQAPVAAILNNYKSNVQLKAANEEELLQGKFETAQLKGEEEELLQGKFETAQLQGKEEELLQGKFDTTQLQGNEEELLQGKFETAQLKNAEEEELLQGKFSTAQLKAEEEEPLQKKDNNTGLPDNLKSGVENLSGHSMDDVKVHYNSSQPNQLNAHAYAQGTDIHVAPGQEKHLPHEAWHVVQQKQGRVKPTMQMKGKVNVNDDKGLENEADVMGAKALQMHNSYNGKLTNMSIEKNRNIGHSNIIQNKISYKRGGFSDENHLKNSLYSIFGEELQERVDYWVKAYEDDKDRAQFASTIYKNVIWHLKREGHTPVFGVTTTGNTSSHGPMLPQQVDRFKKKDEDSAMSTFNFSSVTLGKLSVLKENSKISFHDRQINAEFHAEDGLIQQLEEYIKQNSLNPKEIALNLTINNFFCSKHSTGKSEKCNNCLDKIIGLQTKYRFARFHVYFQNTYGDHKNMVESIKALQSVGILVSSFTSVKEKAPYLNDELDPHSDTEQDYEMGEEGVEMSFKKWMKNIAGLALKEYGFKLDELPDEPYMYAYEEGMKPYEFYEMYMSNGKAL
jgi:hypothetical protein